MSSTVIMDAVVSKIKSVLSKSDDVLASEVTPERAEEVNQLLAEALSAGWTAGLRAWLATAESDAETIEKDGVTYRYKLASDKEFLTPAEQYANISSSLVREIAALGGDVSPFVHEKIMAELSRKLR